MIARIATEPAKQSLAVNTLWSLAGITVPMAAAVFLIPFLIQRLGLERFGLLALVWMGVGYFSLFDLGLGKALTHQVATRLAHNDANRIPGLVKTGLLALAGLGLMAMLVVGVLTPWLVSTVLSVPDSMQDEARQSFWILALSLPAVLGSSGLSGVLEGHQRFRTLALIRIPLGISNFFVPAVIAVATPSLVIITLALVVARLAALVVLYRAAQPHFIARNHEASQSAASRHDLATLLRFGGWITVSNIVGPILVYFDRFFLSAILGLAAVAYYVTPYEILSRMMVLPQAIMAALFPAMAQAIASRSPEIPRLASGANRVMVLSMIPPTLAAALFAEELLTLWLDPAFARESRPVVQFLAAGVLVNVLARVPLTALQSAGRADITAKIHVLEVVPYLLVLWWAIGTLGIAGAALAWLLRVSLDGLLLWAGSALLIPVLRRQALHNIGLILFVGPTVLLFTQIGNTIVRGALWFAITAICSIVLFKLIRPLLLNSRLYESD